MRLPAISYLLPLGLLPLAWGIAQGQALPQPAPNSDWSGTASQPPPAAPPANSAAAPFHDFGAPTTQPTPPPPIVESSKPVGAPEGEVTHESVAYGPSSVAPATADAQVGDLKTERSTSNAAGANGLYRSEAADIGPVDVLRIGLYGQYFGMQNFPVQQANDQREVGILNLSFTPLKYLEVYGGTRVSSNISSGQFGTSPNYTSELGDFWIGVHAGWHLVGGLSLGGDLRLDSYSSVGTSGVGAAALSPTLLATYDFLQVSRVPVRLHLNIGGFLDFGSLGNLTATNAQGNPVSLTLPEQFAYGYTPYNQLRANLGVEIPLPYVTPFLEYQALFPLGVSQFSAPCGSPSPTCPQVSYLNSLPGDLDVGVRVTAIRDVSLLAALDLSTQSYANPGVPVVPDWQLFFGLSYNWDPLARSEVRTIERSRAIERKVEVEEKPGRVQGTVVDDGGQPVAGALITLGGSGLPPVASGVGDGQFRSYGLPPGPIDLSVSKDGYVTAQAHAQVEKGKTVQLLVTLKREARPISLKVEVHGLKGKPLAAKVTLDGPKGVKKEFDVPASGEAEIALQLAGSYALRVSAPGYLGKASQLDLPAGKPAQATFTLSPEPKRTVLLITANKIRLKKQIHFETSQSKILADSFGILDQVVDALVKHHVDHIRIEGHTDNVGNKEHNLALSQERANAVRDYLIKAGIPQDHIEAVGYGDSRPIAPNLTNRGRAMNRRVEFDIL